MLRLQQGQIWKRADDYLRIVELHRLEVKFKAITNLETREGTHHHVSKKEFCRMIKGATLLESAPSAPSADTVPGGSAAE